MNSSVNVLTPRRILPLFLFPVDTGRKLNVHKTFRRRPGRLLNVLCTFNLRPVSTGLSTTLILSQRKCFVVYVTVNIVIAFPLSDRTMGVE